MDMQAETNSVSPGSSYTHTEQSLAQDLSLKQISKIFLNNWLLFACLFLVFSTLATFIYVAKIPYVAQSAIIVNDAQNSSLQSLNEPAVSRPPRNITVELWNS